MRWIALVLLALLVCSFSVADDAKAPEGVKLTGPHSVFTFTVPADWQHESFESKVDKQDEKFEYKVGIFGEKRFPTDNFYLWWYAGAREGVDKGSVSLSRAALEREVKPEALVDEIQKDPQLPKDAKTILIQSGKYVGLRVMATVEDMSTDTVTIINGKVAYIGLLMGPKDAVQAQGPAFLKLLATLDAADVAPAKLDDMLGVKAEEPLKPGQLKSKSGKFILDVPEGWQHSMYDNPDDKPNAKLIMQVAPIAGKANITDNINLWWGKGGENMMTGLASVHRLEATEGDSPSAQSLVDSLKQSGQLPQGMEASVVQVGDYVGALVGGPFQNVFYGAAVVIPQGKSMYLASILGPVSAVQPQWPAFMAMVASLKADDLKPQKLEDAK